MYERIAANRRNTCLLVAGFLSVNIGFWFAIFFSFSISLSYLLVVAAMFVGLWVLAFYQGDRAILIALDAVDMLPGCDHRLERIVEEMSIAAGIPAPRLVQIDTPALNAFALGRDPAHAVLGVTAGLVHSGLDDDEMRGIVAHEVSHIRNHDILYHTMLSALVGLGDIIRRMLHTLAFSDVYGGSSAVFGILGVVTTMFAVMVALVFSNLDYMMFDVGRPTLTPALGIVFVLLFIAEFLLGGRLCQSLFSKNREFLADACAVQLTRYPDGLIKALRRMEGEYHFVRSASSSTTHLFVMEPQWGYLRPLFLKTHPSVAKRIERLRHITAVPTPPEESPKNRQPEDLQPEDLQPAANRWQVFWGDQSVRLQVNFGVKAPRGSARRRFRLGRRR